MIRFKEILPTDKPAMDRRLAASGIPSCDYTFANIYCWRHTYGSVWAEFDDIMAVRFELGAEGYRGYMLSEQGDYCRIVPELMEDARAEGIRFRMVGMSRDGAEAFRASHTLKGICLNLGFTALCDASSALTEKLRGNNTLDDESRSLFARLHEEYDRTIQAIEKLGPQ